jgi:hypothetical protein
VGDLSNALARLLRPSGHLLILHDLGLLRRAALMSFSNFLRL